MKIGYWNSMAAVLAGTGAALAQAPNGVPQGGSVVPPAAAVEVYPTEPGTPPPGAYGPFYNDLGPDDCDFCSRPCPHVDLEADDPYPWTRRFYASGEYLLWRFSGDTFPAFSSNVLVGNVPINSVSVSFVQQGVNFVPASIPTGQDLPVNVSVSAGAPGGSPGRNTFDYRDQPGFRVNGGYWLDDNQCIGVDASFFWLWERTSPFNNVVDLPGQTINTGLVSVITPPAVSGNNTIVAVDQINVPVFFAANTRTAMFGRASNQIWGAEANIRHRALIYGGLAMDVIGGFRYFEINQEATINQLISIVPSGPGQINQFIDIDGVGPIPAVPIPTGTATLAAPVTINLGDRIKMQNHYYGAQVGLACDWCVAGNWFISGHAKLMVGGLRTQAQLLAFNSAGADQFNGGLIVSRGDSGNTYTWDRAVWIPDLNINLGYAFSRGVRIFAGYNLIYFSSVAKVGNAVSPTVTDNAITLGNVDVPTPTVIQPGFKFNNAEGTLQGLNAGLEFRY